MTQETDIHVLAFFTADHAVAVEGKVYVNGGFWDRVNFATYPQLLSIALVGVIHVPFRAYHQDHKFAFGMEDADGKELPLRVEGQFRVGAEPDMKYGDPTVMPIAVVVNNVLFEKPGDYSFILRVDGTELSRWPVRAVQVASAMPIPLLGPTPPTPPEPSEE